MFSVTDNVVQDCISTYVPLAKCQNVYYLLCDKLSNSVTRLALASSFHRRIRETSFEHNITFYDKLVVTPCPAFCITRKICMNFKSQ